MKTLDEIKLREARLEDASLLPDIEQSAGLTFRTVPHIAWVADAGNRSVEEYEQLIRHGLSWISFDDDEQIIGFLIAEPFQGGVHLVEIAIKQEFQRLGHGRALLTQTIDDAKRNGRYEVTLTTFCGVPFNEAYYQSFGFETLEPANLGDRLAALLDQEVERGLSRETRCAMRLNLSTT